MKKFLSITLSVILMLSIIPLTVYADDSDNVYCQYTGSTTASWGYKPNCTFTVNKIVGDKFIISLYSSITKCMIGRQNTDEIK